MTRGNNNNDVDKSDNKYIASKPGFEAVTAVAQSVNVKVCNKGNLHEVCSEISMRGVVIRVKRSDLGWWLGGRCGGESESQRC